MKIEFVNPVPRRSLGELNTSAFFCKGCGMLPASDDCPVCRNLVKRERRPSILERLFPDRWFSVQVIVGIIAVIIALQMLFSRWQ